MIDMSPDEFRRLGYRAIDLLARSRGHRCEVVSNAEGASSHDEPYLQRAEAAALLDTELGKPGERIRIAQIRRHEREYVAHRVQLQDRSSELGEELERMREIGVWWFRGTVRTDAGTTS